MNASAPVIYLLACTLLNILQNLKLAKISYCEPRSVSKILIERFPKRTIKDLKITTLSYIRPNQIKLGANANVLKDNMCMSVKSIL